MRARQSSALHSRFLRAFLKNATSLETSVRGPGADAWSDYASAVLHAVQTELGFYCACNRPANKRHVGQRGEWLWDFTWYDAFSKEYYAPPLVVIEHENSHYHPHFMRDFWKMLAANAGLRVMIGYTGRGVKPLERRIELIHNTVKEWQFPESATDVILLRRYAHPTWEVLLREAQQTSFTRYSDDAWRTA